MKKVFFYLGNLAQAVIALFLYGILQNFYFFPAIIHQKYHLSEQIQVLITALLTVFVLWLIFWMYKRQLKEVNNWGFNQEPHWQLKKIGTAIIGFFLIWFLGVLTLQLVSQGKSISTNQQVLNKIELQSGNLFKIMVAFIAPFCEETVFRGMFFNTFFTKATSFNKWIGILVSGLLFAYMHDPAFSKFIFVYWTLGSVLAWVYIKTKDLRYSILVHMAYNAIGFI